VSGAEQSAFELHAGESHIGISHKSPVQSEVQEQSPASIQVPLFKQDGSHIGVLQSFPVYPVSHPQILGATHVLCDKSQLGELHIGMVQFDPDQPASQTHCGVPNKSTQF
jgi:hypothetical protein